MCPISYDRMLDPVIAADGISYEREAFLKWVWLGHLRPPVMNVDLSTDGARQPQPTHADPRVRASGARQDDAARKDAKYVREAPAVDSGSVKRSRVSRRRSEVHVKVSFAGKPPKQN